MSIAKFDIVKEIDLPPHVTEDLIVCKDAEEIANNLVYSLLRKLAKERREYWNEVAKLLGYKDLKELEKDGNTVRVSLVRQKLQVIKVIDDNN